MLNSKIFLRTMILQFFLISYGLSSQAFFNNDGVRSEAVTAVQRNLFETSVNFDRLRRVSNCNRQISFHCRDQAFRDFHNYSAILFGIGVREQNLPFIRLAKNPGSTERGTIILIHGLTANPSHMKDLAEDLSNENYNVIVPVLFGHGGDDSLLERASLAHWRKDIQFASAVAQRFTQPLYIVGHSTGGALAALESSAQQGLYKAVVGLDPTLNLYGPRGFLPRNGACAVSAIASYLESYNERVASNRQLLENVRSMCGRDYQIPDFNAAPSMGAVCGLVQATHALSSDVISRIPPAMVILSQDGNVHSYSDHNTLVSDVLRSTQNRMVTSSDTIHGVMTARCSPGYAANLNRILDWLDQHK